MRKSVARRIARLLNKRNNLPNKLDSHDICYKNYFYIVLNEGCATEEIIACAQVKVMSFFCYELKHIAVNEKYEGHGLGKYIINLAEQYTKEKKIPVLMATTNAQNIRMNNLFGRLNYSKVKEFTNEETQHPLVLWRKDIL